MPIFWTLFWLGFIGFPLVILLANSIRSSGHERDTSHIWVYKGSKRKSSDASVRDVWKHNNPGKSWEDHQERTVIGCSVFLGLAFLGFLIWLANQVFMLPQNNTAQRLFWQVGGPILGGLFAAAFLGLQTLTVKMKSGFFKFLNILALVLMGVGVVGGLVLTFLHRDLPISHHWIWAPAGATIVLLSLDAIIGSGKQKKAAKGGNKLESWTMEVIVDGWGYSDAGKDIRAAMGAAAVMVKMGKFDSLVGSDSFFERTESLMLDLVQGRQMSISTNEIYKARDEIIKALQAFYFYAIDKYPTYYKLHPRIKAKLKKK